MLEQALKQYARMAIKALGGSVKVAELLGIDERVVSNWPRRGLPPDTFDALPPLLRKLGIEAPGVMFRQRMLLHKRVTRPARPQRRKPSRKNGKRR